MAARRVCNHSECNCSLIIGTQGSKKRRCHGLWLRQVIVATMIATNQSLGASSMCKEPGSNEIVPEHRIQQPGPRNGGLSQ